MNEISNNDLIDAMQNCGIEGCEWNGQPWFNGIDVALWLGYDDPDAALQDIVDSQDKRYDADGSLLINEFGVVSLIFSSTLPDVVASKEEELQKIREEARPFGYGGKRLHDGPFPSGVWTAARPVP